MEDKSCLLTIVFCVHLLSWECVLFNHYSQPAGVHVYRPACTYNKHSGYLAAACCFALVTVLH